MIRASRRNWFVRFAYLIGRVPRQTSLCALFWRGIVLMPAILFGLGMLTAVVIVQVYMFPLSTLRIVLIVVGGIAAWTGFLLGVARIVDIAQGREELPASLRPLRGSLPVRALAVAKSKLCPIVDLSDDEDRAQWPRRVQSR